MRISELKQKEVIICQVGDDIILVDVKKKEVEEPCKL